jgi:hypothetical protein
MGEAPPHRVRRRVDLKAFVAEKALSDTDHEWSGIDDRDGTDADLRQGLRPHAGAEHRHANRSARADKKRSA